MAKGILKAVRYDQKVVSHSRSCEKCPEEFELYLPWHSVRGLDRNLGFVKKLEKFSRGSTEDSPKSKRNSGAFDVSALGKAQAPTVKYHV